MVVITEKDGNDCLMNVIKLCEQVFKPVKVHCPLFIANQIDIREEAITSKNWSVIPLDPYLSGFFPDLVYDPELTDDFYISEKLQRFLNNLLNFLRLRSYSNIFAVPVFFPLTRADMAFVLSTTEESFNFFHQEIDQPNFYVGDYMIIPESLDFAILLPDDDSLYGIIAGSEIFVSSILECDIKSAWLNYENYISLNQELYSRPMLRTAPDGTIYEVGLSDPIRIERNKVGEGVLRRLERLIHLYKGTKD